MSLKMKPEIKVALAAVAGIVVLFFGMQFLKGLNLFSSDAPYKMQFDNISGLTKTCPIYANGYKVGTVKEIAYDYSQPNNGISVDVGIDKNMKIPVGSTAEIISDLMGNVHVNLILSKNTEILPANGVISGRINDGAMGTMKDMIPVVQKMLPKLDSILAHVNGLLGDPAMKNSLHNVDKITTDLTTSTQELNKLLAQVNTTLPSMSAKTGKLLDNTNSLMVNANGGIRDARTTLEGANVLIASLNGKVNQIDVAATTAKLNEALDNVNTLTATLNSTKGTMGLLMNDPTLYNNLSNTIRSMDSLMTNLKANPKRYVHFSLFGRKNK